MSADSNINKRLFQTKLGFDIIQMHWFPKSIMNLFIPKEKRQNIKKNYMEWWKTIYLV